MPLQAGDKLGHYEILAPLGVGGMGEVYRARDTRLKREVALKVLPEAVASDPERMNRFQREAEVLASLNHPHIAQIYGVEERALVIELVEGETLRGPLPIDTALHYASQIAAALEAAHEKGITHRDLKPANIMITAGGVVKVLDFGLAGVAQLPTQSSSPARSHTLTMGATQVGTLLGTPAYMAPEQARAKPVDKRADIWAFGAVLFEMLTGKQAFEGEDVAETLASVIHKEPDLASLPMPVRSVVERCLRKDPRKRMRDIGDVQMALEEAPPEREAPFRKRVAILPWTIAALLAIILGFSLLFPRRRSVDRPLLRLPVDLGAYAMPPATFNNGAGFALAPDGSRLVYSIKGSDGQLRLVARRLDQSKDVPLFGTEGAVLPFFSPNGQWIGFSAGDKLKKISIEGGAVTVLCDAPNFRGAAWTEDGFIMAALDTRGPLVRISETGGFYKPATELDKASGETTHRWPQMLPSGKEILFTSHTTTGNYEDATIVAQSLVTGRRSMLWKGGSYGRYVPAGYLIFVHSGALFAAPMNLDRLKLTRDPVPILEGVESNAVSGGGGYDFARNGLLVFQGGEAVRQEAIYWISNSGPPKFIIGFPGAYSLHLSPDGGRIALGIDKGPNRDVWIYDLERETRTRLTFRGSNADPIWTPDGKDVLYVASAGASNQIQSVHADGTGDITSLYSSSSGLETGVLSPDGKTLMFGILATATGGDLWTLPVEHGPGGNLKAGPAQPFVSTPFNEHDPDFSPDGHWIAYVSDETGRNEVYVRSFPGPGGRWQISNSGGMVPKWSHNGRELFFIAQEGMMVASYRATGESFMVEKPRLWAPGLVNPAVYRRFDLAPDGKRFLYLRPLIDPDEKPAGVTFLINFFDELRRRTPAR